MPSALPRLDLMLMPSSIGDILVGAQQGQMAGFLALPIAFGTADATVLYTVPAGLRMHIVDAYWEPSSSFTGGASSAIGLSSSNAAYNTRGDLLGGAGGDVAAQLVASATSPWASGAGRTIGAKVSRGILLIGGDSVRFDRVTSAFTAGSGFAHLKYRLVPAS